MTEAQVLVETEKEHTLSRQSANFVDLITILRKDVLKGLDRKRRKLARLMFHLTDIRNVRLGNALDDHMIEKFPKPPKDNEKRRNQVHFNEKGNCACDNGKHDYDHKIYASMARMSSDDELKSGKYGDS